MLGWPNVGFDIDFGEKNDLLLKSWLGSFLKFYLILMHLENYSKSLHSLGSLILLCMWAKVKLFSTTKVSALEKTFPLK